MRLKRASVPLELRPFSFEFRGRSSDDEGREIMTQKKGKLGSDLSQSASAPNHSVGSDFALIDTEERTQILLRSTVFGTQPNVLWTQHRTFLKRFLVKRYQEHLGILECEFTGRASQVLNEVDLELDRIGADPLYFNIRCQESSLFFRLSRKDVKIRGGLFTLQVPKKIFEVQRRAQLRYRVSEGDAFQVESELLLAGSEKRKMLDFSSGGAGVQISFADVATRDAFAIPLDARASFVMRLEELTFRLDAEIRYVRNWDEDVASGPALRVGFRFFGVKQDVAEFLQLFVLERSYERFKAMFDEN